MATLDDLLDEQAIIKRQLDEMEANPESTEEQDGDLRDTLIKRWKSLETRKEPLLQRMADLQLIQRSGEDPRNVEHVGDGESGNGGTPWRGGRKGPEFMQRTDPWADREQTRNFEFLPSPDLISRAQAMVERSVKQRKMSEDYGDAAMQRAQDSHLVARHMLRYSDDEYYEAFRAFLNDPMQENRNGYGDVSRASLGIGTAATSGQVMLPTQLDPTIVLTSDGSSNPFRQLAAVKQTTTNAWHGVNSASVSASMVDERATAAEGNVAPGAINVFVKRASAWLTGTFEFSQDTNYADQVPMILADAKDILEEAQLAKGSGANTDNIGPVKGILYALSASQKVNAITTAGAFVGTAGVQDVYNLQAALGPRFRRRGGNPGYVANITNINKIRALDQYGGGSFWVNLGDGTPERLLNHPILEASSISISAATGTTTAYAVAVYGDWSKFYVVDRVGMTVMFEPLVKSTANGAPTGEQGWFAYWRFGADVATPNAFRYLANGSA